MLVDPVRHPRPVDEEPQRFGRILGQPAQRVQRQLLPRADPVPHPRILRKEPAPLRIRGGNDAQVGQRHRLRQRDGVDHPGVSGDLLPQTRIQLPETRDGLESHLVVVVMRTRSPGERLRHP